MPFVSVQMPVASQMFSEIERLVNFNKLLQTYLACMLHTLGKSEVEVTNVELMEFLTKNDFVFDLDDSKQTYKVTVFEREEEDKVQLEKV